MTCRHLGFLKGNFTYHSFARNYTDYMLFEGPRCVGYENSLLHCPGVAGIVTGAHVCGRSNYNFHIVRNYNIGNIIMGKLLYFYVLVFMV